MTTDMFSSERKPAVRTAKTAGFCYGVERAIRMVYGELERCPVVTLGPIIHNASVTADLEAKGARIISDLEQVLPGETVVIRSHGVGAEVFQKMEKMGIPYVDATCPHVKRIHRIVQKASAEGRAVVIMGDAGHPEVQGIAGHSASETYIFPDDHALRVFFKKNPRILKKKVAIVAQTTYNIRIWDRCARLVAEWIQLSGEDPSAAEIFPTVCRATADRQAEADMLAAASDVMLIVGGRHSSNTAKLFTICSARCPRCFLVESALELPALDFSGAGQVGITAGASTPAYIIKEVQRYMNDLLKNQDEDFDFEQALEQSFKKIYVGNRVKGYITAVGDTEVTVDVGTKQTGYIKMDELTDDPSLKPSDVVSVGDTVDLIVTKVSDQEGIINLSKKRADAMKDFDKVLKAKEDGSVLEGTVISVVKGGILASTTGGADGAKVFIPASQAGLRREEKLEDLMKKLEGMVHKKVSFKILEVNEQRGRAVGSIKEVLKASREEAEKKFWETAKIGDVFKGEVKSLTKFGAFVDLGGIDGMVHISELSWNRIKDPSEVVSVGDVLEVYIKDLDAEKNRISLGYKKDEDNPWERFKNEYHVGDVVKATVVSLTPFGAFAQIIPGIDGLIHISQIANQRVNNVKDVLSVGDEADVKITEIDLEKKRISISIRALLEDGEGQDDGEEA